MCLVRKDFLLLGPFYSIIFNLFCTFEDVKSGRLVFVPFWDAMIASYYAEHLLFVPTTLFPLGIEGFGSEVVDHASGTKVITACCYGSLILQALEVIS